MHRARMAPVGAFLVDAGPIFHLFVGKIENVSGRVVSADARESSPARPADVLDGGIFFAQARENQLDVFDFDAEVIEARGTARIAKVEIQTDIAVGKRDGAMRASELLAFFRQFGGEAEGGLVKPSETMAIVGDDRDVFDLARHSLTLY